MIQVIQQRKTKFGGDSEEAPHQENGQTNKKSYEKEKATKCSTKQKWGKENGEQKEEWERKIIEQKKENLDESKAGVSY